MLKLTRPAVTRSPPGPVPPPTPFTFPVESFALIPKPVEFGSEIDIPRYSYNRPSSSFLFRSRFARFSPLFFFRVSIGYVNPPLIRPKVPPAGPPFLSPFNSLRQSYRASPHFTFCSSFKVWKTAILLGFLAPFLPPGPLPSVPPKIFHLFQVPLSPFPPLFVGPEKP